MADRLYVRLTVLNAHVGQITAMYLAYIEDTDPDEVTTSFSMGEWKYGSLEKLGNLLAAGIPYDSNWDSSYESEEGTESLRFTPEGVAVIKTCYSSDNGIQISDLLPIIDDHTALKTQILTAQENITILPWDNQEAYGQLYRTLQLITPKTEKQTP